MTPIKSIQYCAYCFVMPMFLFGFCERGYVAFTSGTIIDRLNWGIATFVAVLVAALYPGVK